MQEVKRIVCEYIIILLVLALSATTFWALTPQLPVARANDALSWDYLVADQAAGSVTMFLVCLDGQPTMACTAVQETTGVASTTTGTKTYVWKLPALTVGPHSVAVQACTTGGASCSSGATFQFAVQVVIQNPTNIKLTRVGG